MNLVFQDSDIIPLFVQVRTSPGMGFMDSAPRLMRRSQENYVNMRPGAAGNNDLRRMVRPGDARRSLRATLTLDNVMRACCP